MPVPAARRLARRVQIGAGMTEYSSAHSAAGHESSAARGAEEVAPWLVAVARVGSVAFGLVFIVIGALALKLAVGDGGATTDPKGALATMRNAPLGGPGLAVLGVGLLAFAVWSTIGALFDSDARGTSVVAILFRIGHVLRGLGYGLLGATALEEMHRPSPGGGHQESSLTAHVMGALVGRVFVGLVGLGTIAYAVYQIWWAFTAQVRKQLASAPDTPMTRAVVAVGRFGVIVTSAVLVMIGVYLGLAALRYRPGEAAGIDESLARIAIGPGGHTMLGIVGAGFIAFGTYQLANAAWRRMPVTADEKRQGKRD